MNSVLSTLLFVIYILLGAGDIYFAISHFKRKHYFMFGMWVMFAISSVLQLIKIIFVL